MANITADRFNNLKARVQAECKRRNKTGNATGSSSVETYGGTSYQYSTVPTAGGKILLEHRDKNITPLKAINSTTISFSTGTAGTTKVTDTELTQMEAFVTTLEGDVITTSSTHCEGGCTGLCYGCTGCSTTCLATCEDDCNTDCSSTCAENCDDTCGSGCSSDCSGNCGEDCSTSCDSSCSYGST